MEEADAWRLTDGLRVEHGKGDPFAAALRATRMPMIITDPRRNDNPIIFANDAFLTLTGYDRVEVDGRNCRFLQGPETDKATVARIRDAVTSGTDVATDILNYRKDGSSFWNALYISPVRNEAGDLNYFFASQLDVTERKNAHRHALDEKQHFEAEVARRTAELEDALAAKTLLLHEVDHRVKNNLQMISSLIILQSRRITDPIVRQSLMSMLERVEALSTVHRRLYQSDDVTRFDVAEFARDLATELVAMTGRSDIGLEFDLETIAIPAEKAAPVALIFNELFMNALRHAFVGDRAGTIRLRARRGGECFDLEVADDGVGMANGAAANSFGRTLVQALGRQLRAEIEWQDGQPGTRVRARIPVPQAR